MVTGYKEDFQSLNDLKRNLKTVHPEIQLITLEKKSLEINNIENSILTNSQILSKEFEEHCWKEDFISCPWLRSSWFNLKFGTSHLHVQATLDAAFPWGPENDIVKFACSDLNQSWTGWLEGGIIAGKKAANSLHLSLFPSKIPKNFTKYKSHK
jgi:monoamine oxidase